MTGSTEFITKQESIRRRATGDPKSAHVRNFSHNESAKKDGAIAFHWKEHHDLVLRMRWVGNDLVIEQSLTVGNEKFPTTIPFTYGDGLPISFNRKGEAVLKEKDAHICWQQATGLKIPSWLRNTAG